MSHNHNFNNNFCGSNFTFRYAPDFPPPPLPPPLLIPVRPRYVPPQQNVAQTSTAEVAEKNDQEFIKKFETHIPDAVMKHKAKATTIRRVRQEIEDLVIKIKVFERQLAGLKENIHELPEEKWKKNMTKLEDLRNNLSSKLEKCVGTYMDMSRRLLAKRSAKRLRLKRLKEERKSAEQERIKQAEEKSRKIDENLQKVKDDIIKAQKAEEAKLEADVVLREVRRQKLDAKRCLAKLDALLKLRKARLNSAKGRGENFSEKETITFINNVEKLKSLWNQKLLVYKQEKKDLMAKLAEGAAEAECPDSIPGVEANLGKWRELLFGDATANPQVDVHGDIEKFIAVRSQWDQYVNEEGTPMPVGWVVPPLDS